MMTDARSTPLLRLTECLLACITPWLPSSLQAFKLSSSLHVLDLLLKPLVLKDSEPRASMNRLAPP